MAVVRACQTHDVRSNDSGSHGARSSGDGAIDAQPHARWSFHRVRAHHGRRPLPGFWRLLVLDQRLGRHADQRLRLVARGLAELHTLLRFRIGQLRLWGLWLLATMLQYVDVRVQLLSGQQRRAARHSAALRAIVHGCVRGLQRQLCFVLSAPVRSVVRAGELARVRQLHRGQLRARLSNLLGT